MQYCMLTQAYVILITRKRYTTFELITIVNIKIVFIVRIEIELRLLTVMLMGQGFHQILSTKHR